MLICAKGFSRRISEKNLRPFCGHPLVYWPILQGKVSKLVDEVIVSTQDDRIADIAEGLGAEVFWRQYEDTDETSGSIPVFEWRDSFRESGRIGPDDIVVTHWAPNCIMLPGDIDRLVSLLQYFHELSGGGCESLGLGATEYTMGISWRTGPNMRKHVMNCINIDVRAGNAFSSGLGAIVIAKGIVSAAYIKQWDHGKAPVYWQGGGPGYYMDVEPWQMQDMDTPEEMEFGEVVMEHFILKGRGDQVYKDYANK